MSISVRLKPEISKVLERECKRQRKTRTALIHEALTAFLQPQRPKLGDVLREVMADTPQGWGLERNQPKQSDPRDWGR
jgi:predicted transcriptional regulator